MNDMLQDLRYAARRLAARPGFTAALLLVVGLGIGLNATIYSLLDGILVRPMRGVRADDLVWLSARWRRGLARLSYPDYVDYRAASGLVFTELMAYTSLPLSLLGDEPVRVRGQAATASYWGVLGVTPALGRFFGPENDRPAAAPAAVLGHDLWQRRFGGDREVLGRTLLINGHAFTVVGVAPQGFVGPEIGGAAELWVPLGVHALADPGRPQLLAERVASWLQVMGRLRPGVTSAQAGAALQGTARELLRTRAEDDRYRGLEITAVRGGLPPSQRGEGLALGALVMSVSVLLLLIACANVANLLLARAVGRSREIAVRLALGARRSRLVRQLLTESLLLSLVGAGLGALIAAWAAPLLLSLLPPADFQGLSADPSPRVLGFTALLAVGTGLAFGLAPAFQSTRGDVVGALKVENAGAGTGRSRLQAAFVVAQLSLSMVLLLAGGALVGAMKAATTLDLGFDPRNLATASFDLVLQGYAPARIHAFRAALQERLEARPDVASAALANVSPLSGQMIGGEATAAGRDEGGRAFLNGVSPGYFRTLEIPLLRGRDFTAQDRSDSPPVAIVNETLARRLWPEKDPIGERLSLSGSKGLFVEVVGLARDAAYDEPGERALPFVYLPLDQRSLMPTTALLVRSREDARHAVGALREEVQAAAPELPLFNLSTLSEQLANRMDKHRDIGALLASVAALGLLLAAIGLAGVMGFTVSRRTREIGVRMALGARRADVIRMVVGHALRLAAMGALLGGLLGLPASYALSRMFFGVAAADPALTAGTALLLIVVAAAAAYLPARAAARIDPLAALRYE